MKYRNDFVTNSSSSSFIIAFKSEDEAIKNVRQKVADEEAAAIIVRDIKRAERLNNDALMERLNDEGESHAYYQLSFGDGGWWSSSKDTFENRWRKAHPDKAFHEMFEDEEYKKESAKIADEYIKDILSKIDKDDTVIELSYSDNDGDLFSELEHEIVPSLDITKVRFNHH